MEAPGPSRREAAATAGIPHTSSAIYKATSTSTRPKIRQRDIFIPNNKKKLHTSLFSHFNAHTQDVHAHAENYEQTRTAQRPLKARSDAHIPAHAHSRQKSISRLSYFCREHYLGSVGRVPAFSSVSSGRHCTAVIQTHLFPLSPAPHPFHPTSCSIVGAFCLSVCAFLLTTHTRLFVFPLGRTTVPGESIHWQDEKSGWCEITGPHSAQQTLK